MRRSRKRRGGRWKGEILAPEPLAVTDKEAERLPQVSSAGASFHLSLGRAKAQGVTRRCLKVFDGGHYNLSGGGEREGEEVASFLRRPSLRSASEGNAGAEPTQNAVCCD